MGALHRGHLSLLARGRSEADVLIVTIFVNPSQFGPDEDFDRYPRTETEDIAKAREYGIDLAFCPNVEDMYDRDHQTTVSVSTLSEPLCGASRAGHFDGVATIVCKLFNLAQPHVAIFGKKDYQQLALICRMVRDLDFDVEIIGADIVREDDGLALSSRNAYLSPEERTQAAALHRALGAARDEFDRGQRDCRVLEEKAQGVLRSATLASIEYCELRDAASLSPIETIERPAVLALAVHFGSTRLIDNTVLSPTPTRP
jgi:pantoate--beta-alanine ligase